MLGPACGPRHGSGRCVDGAGSSVHTVYTVNTDSHSKGRALVVISQADPRPLYLQVKEQLRHRIAVGELPAGAEIPSIRQLAADIRVSVITIKRAYLELELEGVIQTRQGRGSFVAENTGLDARLKEQELDQHLGAAVDVAALLNLDADELTARLRSLLRNRKPT
jgi:GntR family transcriptional regulator